MICEQCGGNRVFSYPPPVCGCPGCGAPVCCQTCCDARHDGYNREDDHPESPSSPTIPKMQAFAPMEEMARLRAELLAPGVMRCAKCNFGLQRVSLNVNNGTATAGDSKTEPCPNGCGPLWPVTWKELSAEHLEAAKRFFDELEAARKDADKLRAELAELRARVSEPVAWMHNKRVDVIHTSVKSLLSDFAVNSGPESMLRPIDKSEHYTIPLYAAPVPAQPAADVAAIAKAVRDIPSRIESLGGQRFAYVKLSEVIDTIYSMAGKHPAVPHDVAKDAERLDWLVSEVALVQSLAISPPHGDGTTRYHIVWPEYGEDQRDTYATPREAIDAAILAAKENKP